MALPYSGVILYEGIQLGVGLKLDYDRGTTRNTSENLCGAAGAATAAVGGGMAGAKIGTMICPGVGTAVGATIGATMGGIGGDQLARDKAGAVFDRWEYNIKILVCKKCGKRYKCRMYTSQSRRCCRKCADEDYDFP